MEGGHAKEKKAELPIRFFLYNQYVFFFTLKNPSTRQH